MPITYQRATRQRRRFQPSCGAVRSVALLLLTTLLAGCLTEPVPAPTTLATAASAAIAPAPTTPAATATLLASTAAPAAQASRPPEELDCPIGTLTPCETQTLHRAIRLTGTGYALHYASDRVGLNTWDARAYGLGGWMLNLQHAYDSKTQTLYLGDGDRRHIERPVALDGGDLAIASTGGEEVYTFNANGRHQRTLDALTGAVRSEFTYDDDGRLTGVKDSSGNQTTVERDGKGTPTAIIGSSGARTTLSLDSNGYLAKLIDPAEESIAFAYTASGLLTAFTDPEGSVSRFDYDVLGRLDREELPDGSVSSRSHAGDAASYTITLKTAMLRTSTYAVERLAGGTIRRVLTDPGGARIEELIGADGSRKATLSDGTRIEIQWEPDPRWGMQAPVLKQLTQTTPGGLSTTIVGERAVTLAKSDDPLSLQSLTERLTIDGQTSVSEYEAAARTLTTTSPTGRTSVVTLDAQGRVLGEQAADFARASYGYDKLGRLTTIAQGEGDDARGAALSYDDEQGALRMTDPLGRAQELRFDSSGQLSQAILPGDRRVGFGYDGRGNLTALTPPGRPAHSVAYTPAGLPTSYLPPRIGDADQPAIQTYDADGQLTTFTRPDGQKVNFGYDNAGRLSRLNLTRGEITSTYDPATGYLSSLSAPGDLKLAYSYDGGLPTGETWSGPIAGSVGWAYDQRLRVASQSVGGDSIAFAYDEAGLIVRAGDLVLTRDPKRGLVTAAALGSVASTWAYNAFGEPASYSATAGDQELCTVRYSYDKLGRIIQLDETIDGEAHVYGYRYDEASRLAEVRRDGQLTHSYTYDVNGNRLSATTPEGTANGAYDAQDRLTQYGDATYAYTASGELLSKTSGGQTTSYEYDELGSLLGVTLPDGSKLEYLIDGKGRRVGKQVNGALVQGWLYQDDLRPAAELDGAGKIVSRFVYASGRNVPDYMTKGGVTYRILTDHLGSVRLVVDAATGSVAQRIDYDAFGNVAQDSNPRFQPFGFAGGLYDRDTELVRFGVRDYDAQIGRWTAKDPIGFAGEDTNLYGYVANDPVNIQDPTGLWGENYPTADEAALHALEHLCVKHPIWNTMFIEWGGYIVVSSNGGFEATYPITTDTGQVRLSETLGFVLRYRGVEGDMRVHGRRIVGLYHTHPANLHSQYIWGGDKRVANSYRRSMYLGTWTCGVLKYDPNRKEWLTLRPPGPDDVIPDFRDGGVTDTSTATATHGTGRASTSGEPHLRTLDGYSYDFQAVGEFVALRSINDDLQIQVRQAQSINLRTISLNKAIAMNVAGDRIGIYASSKTPLLVNGRPLVLTGRRIWLPSGASIEKRSNSYTVTWPDRSAVQVDHRGRYLNITLSLPEARRGALAGLLGNFDGDPKNDLAIRDGVAVNLAALEKGEAYRQLYKVYGDSWRITQAESLFDYGPGEDTTTFTDLPFPDKPVTLADLDEATRKAAEQTCRNAGVTEQPYLDDCILDVGLTGDADFAQGAAQVIAAVTPPTPAPTSAGLVTRSIGGQIAFGETVAGALAAPTEIISYTLTAKADDTIVAQIVPEGSGSFELSLFDPRAQTRAPCNNVGCRAATDGDYTLQVRYRDAGDGKQPPYKYSLFVDRANDPINAPSIVFGQMQIGALDAAVEIDSYALTAQANDMLVANILSEDKKEVDVYLFDPRQHFLTQCNYVGCLAKTDGIYYLQIRSRNAAESAPPYRYTFYLDRANNPANVQPLAFGQTITGVLTDAIEIDSYALKAETNSMVMANVVGSANVSFDLFLYDSQTQLLCTFNEVGCLAKTDGLYHIQVRLRDTGRAPLPYAYTLFVDRANNPINVQPITFGQSLAGELKAAAEIDSYAVTAHKNERIAATVKSEGDTTFALALFDPQQQKQYFCTAAGCQAPSDGTYYLQVRYAGAAAATPPYRYSIAVQQR